MICAPSSSKVSWGTPFTEAAVPTGINTGVSTNPWAVVMCPSRAAPVWVSMVNGRVTEMPCGLRLVLGVTLGDSCRIDEGPAYRPSANFFHAIVGGHAKGIKAAIYGFQHRLRFDFCSNPSRCAVLDINR